ncbi:hypothetical protein ASPACDRAFT_43376 [Aspergillus aculeatus ATCC 16872]|uniref:S-formylglutathione hydrolase n=2 Tax=Aspergillus subgen. Circumdati TaxID=2720871 RepID=A0A1L9WU40_ASPA1|nr:uncharacterized protein ASPACDRAFT_43376 [Aspergillus aculeatus ATCC 16872]OJJ99744.1 hypothetical protein ASPACDRAFT_43376 [Aspergillus aculeatus ATCC 16872]
MSVTTKATIASFGGKLLKLSHAATSTKCEMSFNLYLPPQAFQNTSQKIPVLLYLSGLTCTADNCSEKGFFQHGASKKGIAVLYPDTSPRGLNLAGENDAWDFGTGAGFYVDATKAPYDAGYNMYTYITEELPAVVFQAFPVLDADRFLRNPGKYKSVSAFAPISNPINCPWGQKAFGGYFGEELRDTKWKEHDATELVRRWKGGPLDVLIDVGTGDNFYKQGQLLPENLEKAAREAGVEGIKVRYQPDYDHSYYTMATFSDDHVEHAAKYLFA